MLPNLFRIVVVLFAMFFLDTYGKAETYTFYVKVGESIKIQVSENSSNVIHVNEVPSSASMLLFEAHSHIENITLSEAEEACIHCSITGQNIGMTYSLRSWESEAYIWLLNKVKKNITVLIIISSLAPDGPIPGGCNMEFSTEIAPYLRLRSNIGTAFLEFQHASIGSVRDEPAPSCSLSLPYITYDIYVTYMKENDFSEMEYFNKITSMSNSSVMKQNSDKVLSYSVHPDTRFSFLMYPNVGVVYNVVAKYTINGAVREVCYVPISSYGCGKSEFTEFGCMLTYNIEDKALLFLLSMYGFLTAYFGHTFFSSSMFFFGFLATFFVSFVIVCRFSSFTFSGIIKLSGILGILGGGVWLGVWLWLHNSVISLLLVGFVLGFLTSATILYSPIGNNEINLNDKNYWLLLATGALCVTVLFLAYPSMLSILGSSVVGSYVMLLFYDDFLGTRLAYIILNVVKRTVSQNLEFAANNLPFEAKDIMIYMAWILLSIFAVIVQSRNLLSSSNSTYFQNKLCCGKLRRPLRHSEVVHCPECNPHQPLCNNNSVIYNTFPK